MYTVVCMTDHRETTFAACCSLHDGVLCVHAMCRRLHASHVDRIVRGICADR